MLDPGIYQFGIAAFLEMSNLWTPETLYSFSSPILILFLCRSAMVFLFAIRKWVVLNKWVAHGSHNVSYY